MTAVLLAIAEAAIKGEKLLPKISTSTNYKHWVSTEDTKRCSVCLLYHGKIWYVLQKPDPEPPLHFRCRCRIEAMRSVKAGTATIKGFRGADWMLKYRDKLPDYYISKEDAILQGWKPGESPSNIIPGRTITVGIYKNYDGRLPQQDGRVWQEADINYVEGKRNKQRVLWSNDGLVFVTYDHYHTFYEII